MPRDKRTNISPVEGLAALLHATERASVRNQGVGGTPMVALLQERNVITPPEDSCKHAVELVKGARSGYLRPEFRNEALIALMYQNRDFAIIEPEMWKEAETLGKSRELGLMLRGYKV